MSYQSLAAAARILATDEATLLEFWRKAWIRTTEKGGTVFLDGHQQYKARYILHLRSQQHLSDEEIGLVLSAQQPPYSAENVDQILAMHGKPRRSC